MKKTLAVLFALSLASTVFAQEGPRHQVKSDDADGIGAQTLKKFPINQDGNGAIRAMVDEDDANLPTVANQRFAMAPEAFRPAPLAVNITYHGGDVINIHGVLIVLLHVFIDRSHPDLVVEEQFHTGIGFIKFGCFG